MAMNAEEFKMAEAMKKDIETLEEEIKTLSNMEYNTREKRTGTHRLALSKLFKKPEKKTVWNYWCSQNLDSLGSIILFDADEVQVLIDFKMSKLNALKEKFSKL